MKRKPLHTHGNVNGMLCTLHQSIQCHPYIPLQHFHGCVVALQLSPAADRGWWAW